MNNKSMRPYFDGLGLPVQKGTDDPGGDTFQRIGFLEFGLRLRNYLKLSNEKYYCKRMYTSYELLMCLMDEGRGNYVRHPDIDKWYSNSNVMSRDQATPNVIVWGFTGSMSRLWEFFKWHVIRLGFMTNTRRNGQYPTEELHNEKYPDERLKAKWDYSWKLPDACGPEFFGLYIRGFRFWALYPVLLFTDLETVINSILRRCNKNTDVLNHVAICLYGKYIMPTPWSWLANKINSSKDLNGKMAQYFSGEDPPYLAEMYADLIERM